ncbi:MAG TPA: hypothetical protein P5329_10035 [Candidatus Competibacteraceae bacterium]|nr:hypothetical protein [Candidatus Competibacteraceae bacterium]
MAFSTGLRASAARILENAKIDRIALGQSGKLSSKSWPNKNISKVITPSKALENIDIDQIKVGDEVLASYIQFCRSPSLEKVNGSCFGNSEIRQPAGFFVSILDCLASMGRTLAVESTLKTGYCS